MTITAINSEADLDAAFARLEELWSAEEGSPEARELEALSSLIADYEDRHHPVGEPQNR